MVAAGLEIETENADKHLLAWVSAGGRLRETERKLTGRDLILESRVDSSEMLFFLFCISTQTKTSLPTHPFTPTHSLTLLCVFVYTQ